MARKRKSDDPKITFRIHYGERTPLWDHFWKCVILDLPFTEKSETETDRQERKDRKKTSA